MVAVLGALVIAGEYGTGTIRSSLAAVPSRLPVLGTKALVLGCATFVVAAVSFAAAVPLSTGLLAGNDVDVHLDDPQYWSAVLGGVAYLVLVALIAFAIGALVRSVSGGIAISLGLLLAAPVALSLLFGGDPPAWGENLASLLPTIAGKLLFTYPASQRWVDLSAPSADGGWLGEPWHGALVLVGWVAVLLAVAGLLLRRRDA
ncbi:ABC transporter permease subunit [Isoptericola halotolerans]|uniref:ABC transporter permease subunit n=1 Tax=Isoptericola halotolerans TaxID=300560 RepID=UPI00388D21C3